MIHTLSIPQCNPAEFDKVYLIVRSISILEKRKDKILDSAEQLACLSPSKKLFFQYRDWVKEGNWNLDIFNDKYVPWFLRDISTDKEAQEWLDRLAAEEKDNKIALLCFCKDKALCHRTIIGKLLADRGCNVIID